MRIRIEESNDTVFICLDDERIFRFYLEECECIRLFEKPVDRELILRLVKNFDLVIKEYGCIEKFVDEVLKNRSIYCLYILPPCIYPELYPNHKRIELM